VRGRHLLGKAAGEGGKRRRWIAPGTEVTTAGAVDTPAVVVKGEAGGDRLALVSIAHQESDVNPSTGP